MFRILKTANVFSQARRWLGHNSKSITRKPYYIEIRRAASGKAKSAAADNRVPSALGNGTNADYVEKIYNSWLKDAASVHVSWDRLFKANGFLSGKPSGPAALQQDQTKEIEDHLGVQNIIRSYQTRGHLVADLDPLGITTSKAILNTDGVKRRATEDVFRQHSGYFFGEHDMSREFKLPKTTFIGGERKCMPLGEILDTLEQVYCNTIGVEFMFIPSLEKCNWIRKNFETPGVRLIEASHKKKLLKRLAHSTCLEKFMAKKYASEKRFGLEGCEVTIPALNTIIDSASQKGVESVTIGMAHRGRLNVLANVCHKPLKTIFTQFAGLFNSDQGSGDVKYHLGTSVQRCNSTTNKNMRTTIVANPSHLESVNAVVLGKVRAEQFHKCDNTGSTAMSVLIHGDASFSGQGVVFESMHFSSMPKYTTYGTIHVVINNQIGFTTDPRFTRSSPSCTDVARVINAPIFHVNADDPEAVFHVCKVAADWRATFHEDVVIDLVGYRRNGHNEADEPMFTQPLMYQKIRKHPNVFDIYAKQLIDEKVVTQADIDAIVNEYTEVCEKALEEAKQETSIRSKDWIDSPWPAFFEGKDANKVQPTGVKLQTLQHIADKVSSPPPPDSKFVVHNGITRFLSNRRKLVEQQLADWALAECFAFGSLLKEGVHVRLSGQDVERGTFSHRHHVLHHQTLDKATYVPLQNLYADQAKYFVANSSLSEYAVLGYEHGFSVSSPNQVVIWEAQFGDFSNAGQPIIDQYLCSGESKWKRQSGMVLYLPHGDEGQGPEHSSARPERFLQGCSDDADCAPSDACDYALEQLRDINWIVANCTTPANFFHIMRRQVALPFRKPLILMTPKSLLRHPLARSHFNEFLESSEFQRLLPDNGVCIKNPAKVQKLLLCSGKIYYDLYAERKDRQLEDTIAIVRIEQICPFPYDLLKKELMTFKNASLLWVQEEAKNQGYWSYVQPRIETTLALCINESRSASYVGRGPSAATSTGNKMMYLHEMETLINDTFGELSDEEKDCIKKRKEAEAKAEMEKLSKEMPLKTTEKTKDDLKKSEPAPSVTTTEKPEDNK